MLHGLTGIQEGKHAPYVTGDVNKVYLPAALSPNTLAVLLPRERCPEGPALLPRFC